MFYASDSLIFSTDLLKGIEHTAAQRLALADFGRAGIQFESRKNPKPEKCL